MKKILVSVWILLLFVTSAFPHPGRTDANGGHYDRKTGQYHYHNSGSSSSRSSSSSSTNRSTSSSASRSTSKSGQNSNEVSNLYIQLTPTVNIEPDGFYYVRLLGANGKNNTIKVRFNESHTEDIRLIGIQSINTKKFNEYFKKHLFDKKIWIEFDKNIRDEKGVLIAHFWMEKPNDSSEDTIKKYLLNAMLIDEGITEKKDEEIANKYAEYL
ncbi:MAG: YHYH domain-containing protein [Synergistaceae bacterium]|nr:YHYH domain-containing protein [Synergistaceae bacterium]